METNKISIFALAFILAYANADQNVTSCYYCDSLREPGCVDPFNSTSINSIDCASMIYTSRGLIDDNPIENAEAMERTTGAVVTFQCIKINYILRNGTDAVARNCFKHTDNIDDVCDYIRNEFQQGSIRECHICADDNCNSGRALEVSAVLMGVVFFLLSNI